MKTIGINLGSGYDVNVGSGLIKSIGKTIRALPATKNASKAMVVCDSNIAQLYSNEIVMSLKLAGYVVNVFPLKPVESARRLNVIYDLCVAAANADMRRGDLFVGVGGVIACDIAGIAAALYLGGSPYIAVPTTSLAQISRSVGGRHNADLPDNRRILGLKWQPDLVLCDIDTLKTQNSRCQINGLAEIIKLGCVSSDKLLDELDNAEQDMEKFISKVITLRSKLAVKDERPSGSRPLLHFGDLMCRAIETVSGYSFDYGEALAMGMTITCAAAERVGIAQIGTTEKLEALLQKHKLPTSTNIPSERLLKAIGEDKYVSGETIVLPVIKSIGTGYLHNIKTTELKNFFVRSLPDWAK